MFKKVLATVLAAAMLLTFSPFALASNEASDGYTIANPYEGINWETVKQYKSALHTHTNASDGDDTLIKSLERHYETGFDIVSTTDHGISNTSWTNSDANIVTDFMSLIGKTDGKIVTLQAKGTFDNGTAYEVITRNGDDYLVTADGKEILRLPFGIENNALSVNAHVNSWFAPFEYNLPSDYHETITGVDKAGGVSVINHPGEYTQARYELYQEDAYNLDNWSYRYYFNKFYGYIDKYDSCIGIDINSKGDGRTRYDRKLWDLMLAEAAKEGSTVTAIATSDAHQLDKIDTGSLLILSENKSSESIKNALLNGQVLPQSTCIANRDELAQIADAIKLHYGETKLYNELITLVAEYDAEREEIIKSNDDGQVGVSYTALDDEGYHSTGIRPVINSITVNDSDDTITIDADNALIIRWISDGKLIATTKADDTAFDLNDYEDQIKGYVRAEIFGEGGIVYTEGFTLDADKAAGDGNDFVFNLGFMDFLFAIIDRYSGYLGRVFANIF